MPRRGQKPKPKATVSATAWASFAPPDDLDDVARAELERLIAHLDAKGVLAKTDPRLAIATARTHALIEQAAGELFAPGVTLTQEAANGTLMPHPMIAVLDKLHQRMRGLLADMGLSPKTARLTEPKGADSDDSWGDMLSVAG